MIKFLSVVLLFLQTAHADFLNGPLSLQKKTFTETMPKDVVKLYEQNIKELKALGIEKKALKVGDKVPMFDVTLGGKKYSIDKIYAAGPLVLKFFRGGWCGYCMTELKYYQKMNNDFKKEGSQILALSPDTDKKNKETRSKNGLEFDVVSDPGHEIAKKFGLVYEMDSKIVEHMKENKIDIAQYQGDDKADLSIPATYVITKDGKIGFSHVDADYRTRAEPAVVLEAVKKLKKLER